uniref:Uncharacterized protein n=1 Tax=Manihot esculenta TaxID=3983 RepID=A0A2C9U4E5_MANES
MVISVLMVQYLARKLENSFPLCASHRCSFLCFSSLTNHHG